MELKMRNLKKSLLVTASLALMTVSGLASANDDLRFNLSAGILSASGAHSIVDDNVVLENKLGAKVGAAAMYKDTMIMVDYVDAGVNDRIDFNLGHQFAVNDTVNVVAHAGYIKFHDDMVKDELSHAVSLGFGVNYLADEDLRFTFGFEQLQLHNETISTLDVSGMYSTMAVRVNNNFVISLSHRSTLGETMFSTTYMF
jgi:hypothetical protein